MTDREQYYWSGSNGVLTHTKFGEDMANPFFDTEEEAKNFLERKAEAHGEERYKGMVLRKTGNDKVLEATQVLTDQAGLSDWGNKAVSDD
ncbi:hypothetical protein SAMN05216388_102623 [Halorientalis persicus]|uniref:Uncharacterized protein n=1 Tax=Halorientalis persicus TaxID=1367881 RepID=A0A1H8U8K7_9EURY|nr:hypothetical protein [Halorientalis persicus]SEO99495.1 hypothetical protein SAMN05216388_102623 [Halorientalis persicus]